MLTRKSKKYLLLALLIHSKINSLNCALKKLGLKGLREYV